MEKSHTHAFEDIAYRCFHRLAGLVKQYESPDRLHETRQRLY